MDTLPLIAGASVLASLGGVIVWQRAQIQALKKAQERVVAEEVMLFDFLHGLGEALSGAARPSDLHALIMRGLLRILRSDAGAVYLADASSTELQPAFVARGCPALVDLNEPSAGEPSLDVDSIHRQLRIRHVKSNEGILAAVWKREKAQVLDRGNERLEFSRAHGAVGEHVAIAPLLYAGRSFGVLVLARSEEDDPFSIADMQVFDTLAEQSAFTLRTAEVFSDAADKRRLDHDLEVAQEIQRILLPSRAPDFHRQLRIRHVKSNEGILAAVWKREKAQVLDRGNERLEFSRAHGAVGEHVAIAPLLYAGRSFGVLVLARSEEDDPFSIADMQVFDTLAEQSAFTLRTAEVFSDAADKRRLDHDLEVAQEIQRILLPSRAPDFCGFEFAGMNVPARHVSGDYYDFLSVDQEHCGVVIADVSGKGVPASLIMATCRSVLRSQAPGEVSAAQVLHNVNEKMFPDIKEDMFISMAYAILERESSKVTLCRAGHDAPLLYRASDRSVTKVNPPGMAVGIDSGEAFNRFTRDFSLEMHPNDCLILYTDGVTEALDSEGEEFGMERMTCAIVESAHLGACAILDRLTAELKKFVGAAPQHDDITLIVIRKK